MCVHFRESNRSTTDGLYHENDPASMLGQILQLLHCL